MSSREVQAQARPRGWQRSSFASSSGRGPSWITNRVEGARVLVTTLDLLQGQIEGADWSGVIFEEADRIAGLGCREFKRLVGDGFGPADYDHEELLELLDAERLRVRMIGQTVACRARRGDTPFIMAVGRSPADADGWPLALAGLEPEHHLSGSAENGHLPPEWHATMAARLSPEEYSLQVLGVWPHERNGPLGQRPQRHVPDVGQKDVRPEELFQALGALDPARFSRARGLIIEAAATWTRGQRRRACKWARLSPVRAPLAAAVPSHVCALLDMVDAQGPR